MMRNSIGTMIAVVVVLGVTALAPAGADSLQQQKNTWRNLAVVGGVAAVYGLSRHDAGTALLGLAGAAYAEDQANRDQRIENGCGYYVDGGRDWGYRQYDRDGWGDRDGRGYEHRGWGDRGGDRDYGSHGGR